MKKQINIDVGVRIKFYRLLRGMSQKELADKCGYQSFQAIHLIEHGSRGVPIDALFRICQALQVNEFQLLKDQKDLLEFKELFQKEHNEIKGGEKNG